MSEQNCHFCNTGLHRESVKTILESDHTTIQPGVYDIMHCWRCRKTFYVRRLEEVKEAVPA